MNQILFNIKHDPMTRFHSLLTSFFLLAGSVLPLASASAATYNNLDLTDQGDQYTIDGSSEKAYLTGTLTGGEDQEIYFTSVRGNFLYMQCTDVSNFKGTLTAGPSTNTSSYGTWISLDGSTTDFSNVTFNPNPGKVNDGGANQGKSIDAGILVNFDVTNKTLKIGAISGDGVFRTDGAGNGKTVSIQVGAKNIDTTFSGSFSIYGNSNYKIEKVGTGTWTITSDYEKYYSGAPVGTNTKNNYTGTTTITAGTIQLGNGGTVGHLGTSTNSSQLTKIIIGENGTLAFNRSDVLQFYNNIQSSGTINVVGGEVALRGTTSGSIIKTGAGILAIGNDNGTNLTKITVKEGILDNYAASRLGDGKTTIVLDGGTFREKTDNVTLSNKFSFKSASTINIPENVTTYISSRIDDVSGQTGVLTKTGKGTLVFTGANEYTGGYIIEQGTIQCGNNDDGHINNSASVTLNSGTSFGYNRAANTSVVKPTNVFTVNGGKLFNSGARAIAFQNVTMQSGGLKLENTGTSTLEANVKASSNTTPGWLTFNGTTDGDITANVNGSSAAQYFGGLASANNVKSIINYTSSDRAKFMNLRGDLSTFCGNINVKGNCWVCFDSGTALGSEKASFNLSMTKDCGLLFESGGLNNKTIKMGDLTGTGWVRSGNGGSNVTLEVGALGNDSTFSGAFVNWQSRGLTVKKVGDGNWTFASANQVSGVDYANSANVVVDSGTLTLNRKANQASANNMTVNKDAVLVVAGQSQKVSNLVTLNSGSVLELDVTGAALPSLTAKTLDIKDGAKIEIDFSDSANPFAIGTLELLTADDFKVNGTSITSDDAMKSFLENYVEVNADWALISYIPNATTGYTVLLQTNFNAVPEPAAWLLALLGFAGLGVLRRRRFQRR
ncbi:MAG: autotransporter-associated beta strand repeat-containing protein [Thermoguttaceae bacterium]|nr:autotransporter-associated beta strand repeat-containing protein [Thermoguttaceae bacterium]